MAKHHAGKRRHTHIPTESNYRFPPGFPTVGTSRAEHMCEGQLGEAIKDRRQDAHVAVLVQPVEQGCMVACPVQCRGVCQLSHQAAHALHTSTRRDPKQR